jgi:hypothetical protein
MIDLFSEVSGYPGAVQQVRVLSGALSNRPLTAWTRAAGWILREDAEGAEFRNRMDMRGLTIARLSRRDEISGGIAGPWLERTIAQGVHYS